MTDTAYKKLLKHVVSDPQICGGEPCVRGTRMHIAIILDSLAEGLSPTEVVDHYPPHTVQDVRAAIACAAELSRLVSAA